MYCGLCTEACPYEAIQPGGTFRDAVYFFDAAGNRNEVFTGGYWVDPDHEPVTWTEEERKKGQAWGLKTIESFHTHGTPPLPDQYGKPGVGGKNDLLSKGTTS